MKKEYEDCVKTIRKIKNEMATEWGTVVMGFIPLRDWHEGPWDEMLQWFSKVPSNREEIEEALKISEQWKSKLKYMIEQEEAEGGLIEFTKWTREQLKKHESPLKGIEEAIKIEEWYLKSFKKIAEEVQRKREEIRR